MRKRSVYGWVAAVSFVLLFIDLASAHFIGSLHQPKVLLDQYPNLSAAEWEALMNSPVQRVRAFLTPLWRHNDVILPALLVTGVGSLVMWRSSRGAAP